MKLTPHFVFFQYTHRCNSRCMTCGIWKSDGTTLDVATARRMDHFIDPAYVQEIYFTGGEPLLPENAVEMAVALQEQFPDAILSGATNGLRPEVYAERVAEMRCKGVNVRLQVSLNGLPELHDRTRGIAGGYGLALDTARRLHGIGALAALTQLEIPGVTTDADRQHIGGLAREMGVGHACSRIMRSNPWFCLPDDGATVPTIRGCHGGTDVVCVHPSGELTACQEPRPALWFGNLRDDGLDPAVVRRVLGTIERGDCQPCGCCTTSISRGIACMTGCRKKGPAMTT